MTTVMVFILISHFYMTQGNIIILILILLSQKKEAWYYHSLDFPYKEISKNELSALYSMVTLHSFNSKD